MKLKICLAFFAAALIAASCDPNGLEVAQSLPEDQIVAPALNSIADVTVSQANYDSDDVVSFSWSPADFGFNAAVDYALYLESSDGKSSCLASGITSTSYSIDYKALYNRLIGESYLGLTKGASHDIKAFVTATIGTNFAVVQSAKVDASVDIARVSTGINMLYISGDFNSNHPDKHGIEEDSPGSKTYSGLVNMKNASLTSGTIRFLEYTYAGTNDGRSYGYKEIEVEDGVDEDGNPKTKKIQVLDLENEGVDIVADAELAYIKADLNTGTFSIKTLGGPVRLCGLGGWWFGGNPELAYNASENAWIGTAEYSSGTFRISINDDWGYTFGPKDVGSLTVNDGGDIKIYHNDIAKKFIGGDANFKPNAAGRYTFRFYYESADGTWHLAINLAK